MYSLKYIGQMFPQGKFKRIIFLGLRDKPPTSLDLFNKDINSSKTIEEEIIKPSYSNSKNVTLPILVIWENTKMERFYAEVV